MLTGDEIKLKIEALEAEAARVGEPDGAHYRELAMKWRLVGVEAVVTETMRRALAEDEPPPSG